MLDEANVICRRGPNAVGVLNSLLGIMFLRRELTGKKEHTYSESYLSCCSSGRYRKLQILCQVEAQGTVQIISHVVRMYHISSLHHDVEICAIFSISRLIENTVSRAMSFWDRDVDLIRQMLQCVRRRDAEDVDDICTEIWC